MANPELCPEGAELCDVIQASKYDKELAWLDWTTHLKTCPRCIAYTQAEKERAKSAVHPELTSDEMEAI
jgi:hypothetical protein